MQQSEGHLLVESKSRVERLEVLEGPTGRRSWSDRERARIVLESFQPGVLVRDVALRNGLAPQHLSTWRRLAREGKLVLDGDEGCAFAALVVTDEQPPRPPSQSSIEIDLGGVIVRLPANTAAKRIAEIVAALARPGRTP